MLIGLDKPLSTPRRWRERLLPDGDTELPANIHSLGLIAIPYTLSRVRSRVVGDFTPISYLFFFTSSLRVVWSPKIFIPEPKLCWKPKADFIRSERQRQAVLPSSARGLQ